MGILKEIKDQRLIGFILLWAGASFFEQMEHYYIFNTLATQINFFAIVCSLCRPSWPLCLLFLAFSNCLTAVLYMHMNYYSNHSILENLINCSILAIFIYCFIKRKFDPESIYQSFSALMRAFLIGLYFCAFWAKLNPDFLDPRYSCAVVVLKHICRGYPLFHWILKVPQVGAFTIWITIILEGSFPLLLVFRRTRPWCIAAGLIFHFFLGLSPIEYLYSFSFFVVFLYFFFLPDHAVTFVMGLLEQYKKRIKRQSTALILYALTAAVLYILDYFNWIKNGNDAFGVSIWLIPYILITGVYIIGLLQYSPAPVASFKNDFSPKYKFLWIFIGIFLFNAISPYTGLKTQGGLNMYSNLRIFSGKPNHLIMPASMVLFKQHMVKILDSNNKRLMSFAQAHYLLPEFEFRRMVQQIRGDFIVHCIYQGQEILLYKNKQGTSANDLMKPIPWIESTLFSYKPEFDGDHNCYCRG